MELKLPISLVQEVLKTVDDKALKEARANTNLVKYVRLDGTLLGLPALKALRSLVLEKKDSNIEYVNQILFLWSAIKGGKPMKVHKMAELGPAVLNYIKTNFISGYVFELEEFNAVLPYLITEVIVQEARPTGYGGTSTPFVSLRLKHVDMNGEKQERGVNFSITLLMSVAHSLDIEVSEKYTTPRKKDEDPVLIDFSSDAGIPVDRLFSAHQLFKETEDLHALYQEQAQRFLKALPLYGKQFRVRGEGTSNERTSWWHSSRTQTMTVEGKPGRCILDLIPTIAVADENQRESSPKSRYRRSRSEDEEQSYSLDDLAQPLSELTLGHFQDSEALAYYAEKTSVAPLHPVVRIFHLERNAFFDVHVNNIVPYKYKDNIDSLLVLPSEIKDTVRMLVDSDRSEEDEDVIEGKSQSTIIACIGDPGVGKTLTAEVVAESAKKPLYKIPADQLGGTAEELERNLSVILRRAERWDCVLMIDEANAYVHSRGHDIAQNAIVGVFLRRLEYFRGILFFTTNLTSDDELGYDIDDAMLSRCDAVIHMKLPTKSAAAEIWKVQAKLLNVDLAPSLIHELVDTYEISGRTIRKLLRQAKRWSSYKDVPLNMSVFKTCAKHIHMTRSETSK